MSGSRDVRRRARARLRSEFDCVKCRLDIGNRTVCMESDQYQTGRNLVSVKLHERSVPTRKCSEENLRSTLFTWVNLTQSL